MKELLEENAAEDLLSVNYKTLQSAIKNGALKFTDSDGNVLTDEDEIAKHVPDFITHFADFVPKLSGAALKNYREKYS